MFQTKIPTHNMPTTTLRQSTTKWTVISNQKNKKKLYTILKWLHDVAVDM